MLAIPNFSEGRDDGRIAALARALTGVARVTLLDTHRDSDHNRSVYTLHAPDQSGSALVEALMAGAARALELLDVSTHTGVHPRIGVLDVAPFVYLEESQRGGACARALLLADRLGHELELPVFLYGELSGGRVTRAQIRHGGPHALAARIRAGEQTPDFGPARLHPRGGAVLVGARPPLVAFNVELAPPATLADAKRIAALIREGGEEGLPGVRAIGLSLHHHADVAQVSTNIEDYTRADPAAVVAAVARHARPLRAELVGLAPRAAFQGFPAELPVANLRYVEDALDTTPTAKL